MDPVTLAAVSIGSSVAGGGIKAIGDIMSGNAQANMYNYQAGVARANAAIAKQDANYATAAGDVSAQETGLQERFKVGQTRAGFGAGNVAGASVNRVVSSEIEVGQQNQGIVRANAAKRAYGYNVAAAGDIAQAGADEIAASTSRTSGWVGAASTILGTVGSVSSKWLQMGPAFGGGDNPNANAGYNVTGTYAGMMDQ